MKLPESLEKIKDIKNAIWIGLIVALILDIALMTGTLFMDPNTGYYILMVGLVAITFFTLYLFGWRTGKKMAIAGIGLFLIIGAVWGPMTVHRTYSMDEPEPVSSAAHIDWFTKEYTVLNISSYEAGGTVYAEDVGIYQRNGYVYALDNGLLTPYKGDIGSGYNFTITLYSNDTFIDEPDLTVAYALGVQGTIDTANLIEVDSTDTNYVDGKEFYHLAIIDDEGIYSHVYSLNFQGANTHSLNTTVALGPLVGDESASYGFYALIGIPSMFCNIGMLFVILVLLYWWIGTAKEKRAAWDIDLREKEAVLDDGDDAEEDDDSKPFTCDECGASVGVEDNFCPKCGERFDEDGEESDDSSGPSEQVPLDGEESDGDKESQSQTSPEPAEEDSVTPSAEAPDPQEPAKDED